MFEQPSDQASGAARPRWHGYAQLALILVFVLRAGAKSR